MSRLDNIRRVTPRQLVRELSPEALKYFAELELGRDWPKDADPRIGEFARIGSKIFLGSSIDYDGCDIAGIRPGRQLLNHTAIADRGYYGILDHEGRKKLLEETGGGHGIQDYGSSLIRVDEANRPIELNLFGETRVDESDRIETGQIAREVLGPDIKVIAGLTHGIPTL